MVNEEEIIKVDLASLWQSLCTEETVAAVDGVTNVTREVECQEVKVHAFNAKMKKKILFEAVVEHHLAVEADTPEQEIEPSNNRDQGLVDH